MHKKQQTEKVTFRTSAKLKKQLERLAAEENRSLNRQLNVMLSEQLQRRSAA